MSVQTAPQIETEEEVAVSRTGCVPRIRSFEDGLGWSIVTLGLYYLRWYYLLNNELRSVGMATGDAELADSRPKQSLAAVALVVTWPFSVYAFCRRIERAQAQAGIASDRRINPAIGLMLLPIVFAHCHYVTKHQNAMLTALGVAGPAPAPARASARVADAAVKPPLPARPPIAEPHGAPPTFRVVALGPSGSGKTVFLASMFNRLNFSAPDRHYKLEAAAEQLVELGGIYDELSDTATEAWPAGTDAKLSEFVFDCMSSGEAVRRPILRLSYLDYRGGLLTHGAEPGSTALVDLEQRIQTAHALLAVIDGFRVRQLLLGEPGGHAYFERKVRPMFALMERAGCPIHFVVSKWDLIRDVGEEELLDDSLSREQVRLRLVRDALMQYEHIKAIVYKNADQIVRLIPVSAVGAKFSTLDADGKVVKREDGRIMPMNVEVPLCAVLPDLFAQVEQRLDEPVKEAIRSERRDRQHQQALRVAATALAAVLGGLGGISALAPPLTLVANDLLGLFVGWMGAGSGETATAGEQQRRTGDERAAETQRVRALVMNDFTQTVQKMERALPDSVLTA